MLELWKLPRSLQAHAPKMHHLFLPINLKQQKMDVYWMSLAVTASVFCVLIFNIDFFLHHFQLAATQLTLFMIDRVYLMEFFLLSLT